MPVSEKLQNAWDKAENELIKSN